MLTRPSPSRATFDDLPVRLAFFAQVLFVMATLAIGLRAQANYSEGFESAGFIVGSNHGPDGLIAAGWQFRNQSDPVSSGDWTRWNYAYQGNAALNVNQTVSQWFNFNEPEASSWAILPAIPGQIAGDELRFKISSVLPGFFSPPGTGHFEVRYSSSGQTDTGNNSDDVGDFDTLLADFPDPLTHVWSDRAVILPGSGRIAFRFHIPPAPTDDDFKGGIQIDNLTIGAVAAGPPIPGPGETAVWTAAMSPIAFTEITTIPSGSTVIVEPGVVVDLALTATLTLDGSLIGHGLPGQPVTLQGFDSLDVRGGTLDLDQAVVGVQVEVSGPSSTILRNVAFIAGSTFWTGGSASLPPFIDIDQCQFDGSIVRLGSCSLRLTNSTFQSSFAEFGGNPPVLDNLSFDGSPQTGLNLQFFQQPLFLDNVSITNSAEAGLWLAAANVLVGPNVTINGNQYPAQIGGSGFLDGSVLPATGNLNNHVLVEANSTGLVGGNVWADTGIPYAIPDFYSAGTIDILPGVHVQLGPLAELWGVDGTARARGTPTDPVVFDRLIPGQKWQGLQKFHRFEHCIIDGGEVGARFNSSSFGGFIDSCIIRNNAFGMQNDAVVRKTQFIDNGVGAWGDNFPGGLDGATGANSFEGNGMGVQHLTHIADAPNNWWGDPSGAAAPDNPGGLGDSANSLVITAPFLTARPDYTDHPPIVRLQRHAALMEPHSKVILRWSSEDDQGVVAHRVEFDHPLDAAGIVIIADELPGTARSWEWVVPDIGFMVNGTLPRIRVVAIDTAGQEGWDSSDHLIPSNEITGTLPILSDVSGPFAAGGIGEASQLCYESSGLSGPLGWFEIAIELGADGTAVGIGTTFSSCLPGDSMGIPFASTDVARVRITNQGTSNRSKTFFSEPFTIRPDARLGDAPPSVTMLTPLDGTSFIGGDTIPVTWTAADDQTVRSVSLQASYDAGHTWHYLVEGLPGTATRFNWVLPPSTGIPDVRVRVIAYDRRFQNSSDGADRVLSISASPANWVSLGGASEGLLGRPDLDGEGQLTPGSLTTIALVGARPSAPTLLWISSQSTPTAILGGTLHTLDFLAQFLLVTDGTGAVQLTAPWPTNIPAGTQLWFQFLVDDSAALGGISLSDGIRASTP